MIDIPLGGPLFELIDRDPQGAWVEATDYCRGPWNFETLHGGPVVGLLSWASELVADPSMMCARLTVEMLRPVPLSTLQVTALTVKPGRRTVMIDGAIEHDGNPVARSRSLWLAYDDPPLVSPGVQPPPRPETVEDPRQHTDFDYPAPGFNCDTSELRYLAGSHEEAGPGTTWLRLASPVIASQTNSPFVMTATVSDLAAAAGWEPSPSGQNYINPDVTVQLHRYPRSAWLAIDAAAEQTGNGVALMAATLYDDLGPIGRIMQSLVETPMELDGMPNR